MKISERDILKYVVSPDKLDESIRKHIRDNYEMYNDEIEYYKEVTSNVCSDEVLEISKKIENSVSSIHAIELFPDEPVIKTGTKLNLAAGSEVLKKDIVSYSFTNPETATVVKIIKVNSQTLLYLFTAEFSGKINLILYPSETSYDITDLSGPTEILEENSIERIEIREK